MKIAIVFFLIGLGEGLILMDWYNGKKALKPTKKGR